MRIKIFLMLAILLLSNGLPAQDMLRTTPAHKSDYALVREWLGHAKWVGYNDDSYYFTFGLFDTTGSVNLFMKTQQRIHVKDMELDGSDLYFCGSMFDSSSMSNTAIMGYFDISAMPTPTVKYVLFDSLALFKKLDYYQLSSTKHVVMVGKGKDGRDYIADAYSYSNPHSPGFNSWWKSWTYMPNIDAKFDDIAEVDTNVVVSARIADSSVAYLCYIRKNPLNNRPFFAGSYIYTKLLRTNPSGPILIQLAKWDTLYAFYRCINYLNIHQLKQVQELSAKKILLYTPLFYSSTVNLVDVGADINGNNLDVLLKTNTAVPSFKIFHIPTSQFPSGGTINGHSFGSFVVNSLGKSWLASNTIAAGTTGVWTFYKVQNNATGNCFSLINTTLQNLSPRDSEPQQKDHYKVQESSTPSIMPVTSMSTYMTNECH